jgi:hypothetical protein
MQACLLDHLRPLAVVDLELVGKRGAAAVEQDAAFRLHVGYDLGQFERRVAGLVEALDDFGGRAGGHQKAGPGAVDAGDGFYLITPDRPRVPAKVRQFKRWITGQLAAEQA